MELTQQEIQKRFKELPESLREAIFSSEIAETIIAIGKKYNLPIDKIGELSTETSLVMLGAVHPKDYISELQKILDVERDVARNIAQEVNEQVFAKIREELKTLHNIKDEEKVGIKRPASSYPPSIPLSSPPSQAPFMHKDQAPLPPASKKPYTFKDLQKQPVAEIRPALPPPPKKYSDKIPSITQEQMPSTPTLPQQPKLSSPFEAKINENIFRQEPSESTKEDSAPYNNQARQGSFSTDPYRQPIAPEEASLDINPHITKDE